jgi:glucokinase
VSRRVLAGVDIGGTKTAVVLSEQLPQVLHRIVFPTSPEQGPDPALEKIVGAIREMLDADGMTGKDLGAIGVSCGSPLDPDRGVIQGPPNLPTWTNVPIKSILESEFGAKCCLENDANAGALAEHRFGAGRGFRNLVFLTMGTGIGAGLILDGRLYRGSSYAAGEIGHVGLTASGPVGHNKAGTVEGWASGAGIARLAGTLVAEAEACGERSLLADPKYRQDHTIAARDVWLAAQAGDSLAQHILETAGEKLGQAMAILIDVLNPECIVVGGLAVRMQEVLLEPARKAILRNALASSAEICHVIAAELGERTGDIAALCIAEEGAELSSNGQGRP